MSIFLGATKKSNVSQKKIKNILKAEKLIIQLENIMNDLQERQYDEYFSQLENAIISASFSVKRYKSKILDL
jgi:ribose 5-phosphate isomerase RpiB